MLDQFQTNCRQCLRSFSNLHGQELKALLQDRQRLFGVRRRGNSVQPVVGAVAIAASPLWVPRASAVADLLQVSELLAPEAALSFADEEGAAAVRESGGLESTLARTRALHVATRAVCEGELFIRLCGTSGACSASSAPTAVPRGDDCDWDPFASTTSITGKASTISSPMAKG